MAPANPALPSPEALRVRMHSLLLGTEPSAAAAAGGARTAVDVARWFGAMQAQDLASLQWSLGLRLGGTLADVEAELERGEVLRTWPMRGTLHLVPAEDAAWMVRVLGTKPLAGAARRREYLGLVDKDAERAVELLAGALAGGGRLSHAACLQVLEDGGVSTAGQRGYHLLWYASQRGVTCIAPNVDGEQTFVLLDEWVRRCCGGSIELTREEALAVTALRYFRSHGPAARKDFVGWAGITASDAKQAIAANGEALTTVDVDGVEMVLATEALDAGLPASPPADKESTRGDGWLAVPGFDEYLLGFKERSLMVDPHHMKAVIPGGNGVFRSTLVKNGRVAATWKRTLTAKTVKVEATPVVRLTTSDRHRAERALAPYAAFLGREAVLTWV